METVGIVVWLSRDTKSALVFCSDGREIAVVEDLDAVLDGAMTLRKGDLVGLIYYEKTELRVCKRIWTIAPNERPELAEEIRLLAKLSEEQLSRCAG